jgi:hypothetical protein
MATGALMGCMALVILLNPSIDASWAGLALAFASTLTVEVRVHSRIFISKYHGIKISCIGS